MKSFAIMLKSKFNGSSSQTKFFLDDASGHSRKCVNGRGCASEPRTLFETLQP